tara:strand:- start:49 stop:417 length:369 start_codon:yes stop_codon:yes gene_type:complete
MKRFFYFRPEGTLGNDDAQGDSMLVPVEDITGMEATGATTMDLYFNSTNNMSAGGQGEVVIKDSVSLTVTTETQKGVMKAIVEAMNNGPHEDGITVIADDVLGVYLVPQITSLTSTVAAVIS